MDNFAIDAWALVVLGGLMLAPFICAGLVFVTVKIFQSRLDGYKGTLPGNLSNRYWRFANALAVLTLYTLLIYLLSLMIPILADLSFQKLYWLTNISGILLATLFPLMIYLLIFVFLKKGQLENLYIKGSLLTALYITLTFSVLAVIFVFFADELIYYLAFSGVSLLEFLFYSLVILVIGFFIVLGVVNFGLREVMQKN